LLNSCSTPSAFTRRLIFFSCSRNKERGLNNVSSNADRFSLKWVICGVRPGGWHCPAARAIKLLKKKKKKEKDLA
jgi:hypothetical protein